MRSNDRHPSQDTRSGDTSPKALSKAASVGGLFRFTEKHSGLTIAIPHNEALRDFIEDLEQQLLRQEGKGPAPRPSQSGGVQF